MELLEFLLSNESGVTIGDYAITKGVPIQFAEKASFSAYPLYRGMARKSSYERSISKIYGIAEVLELIGYWFPISKKIILFSDYLTIFFSDDMKASGIQVLLTGDLYSGIRKKIKSQLEQWIDENIDSIEPTEFSEDTVSRDFSNGVISYDLRGELTTCLARCYDKINDFGFDIVKALYCDEEVNAVFDDVCKTVSNFIGRTKANDAELQRRVEAASESNGMEDRARNVKTVLLSLREQGVKKCLATFDFGYTKVTKKISTENTDYRWVEGTQKATEDFEKEYLQPITMDRYFRKKEGYLAYITDITYRNKSVYTVDTLPNDPENELYNAAIYSSNDITKYADKNPDCSIPLKDGSCIINAYMDNFYSTLDGVKFLITHKADGLMAFTKLVENDKQGRRMRQSRNWDEIMKYMYSLYEQPCESE